MNVSGKTFVFMCLALIGVFCLLLVFYEADRSATRRTKAKETSPAIHGDANTSLVDNVKPPGNWIEVGGVWRPPTDVSSNTTPTQASEPTLSNVGRSPGVNKDLNPWVRSVAQALERGDAPERLSMMFEPGRFDRQQYLDDPDTYNQIVEPGRAFRSAPKGPDINPIQEVERVYFGLVQGETAFLKARAEPHMPVTFYSSRLGQFRTSKLTTVTVQADENGVAEAHFTATAGTRGMLEIIAASPTSSGRARFLVNVKLPGKNRF